MTKLSKSPYARKAAALIHEQGPKTREELFRLVGFGNKQSLRGQILADAVHSGWLEVKDGKYGLTAHARALLEQGAAKKPAKYVGQIALPRSINLMNRPAYVPAPKRIPRDDEPVWARRVKVGEAG